MLLYNMNAAMHKRENGLLDHYKHGISCEANTRTYLRS
jgi:hypothetical protein